MLGFKKIHRIPGHSQLSLLQSDCTKIVSNILIGRKKMIMFSIKHLLFILWQVPTYEQYILVILPISTPNSPIPLCLGTLNAPPFPLHVPFFCFVAHQVLVLPGLVEWWFILPARSYAGLEKWPRFPDDSYLNIFTYVILSISLPYHFWILCNGLELPVYPELKSKEKNRVPLYLCPFRRASWTGGARGEPSNSFCDLLKQ